MQLRGSCQKAQVIKYLIFNLIFLVSEKLKNPLKLVNVCFVSIKSIYLKLRGRGIVHKEEHYCQWNFPIKKNSNSRRQISSHFFKTIPTRVSNLNLNVYFTDFFHVYNFWITNFGKYPNILKVIKKYLKFFIFFVIKYSTWVEFIDKMFHLPISLLMVYPTWSWLILVF
jgi:hypothetical protein